MIKGQNKHQSLSLNKSQEQIEQEQRRKNFFQRKRFMNYDVNAVADESDHEEAVVQPK